MSTILFYFPSRFKYFTKMFRFYFSDYILNLLKEGKKFLVFAHHKNVMNCICQTLENNST